MATVIVFLSRWLLLKFAAVPFILAQIIVLLLCSPVYNTLLLFINCQNSEIYCAKMSGYQFVLH